MGGSVFLSHASDDKQRIVALGLIQALQSGGLTVNVDRRESFEGLPAENMRALVDIELGEMWRRDLPRLLEKSNAVLACWSNNYARRFTPEPADPSEGQYVRDETDEARARDYLAHVILDKVGQFPDPYTALKNDKQILELFKMENDNVAKLQGLSRLVKLLVNVIRRRQTRELGSFYEQHAWSAVRFLNRAEQEEPLRPHVSKELPSSLYILFGPKVEEPDQLCERFRQFTMPAQEERHKQEWAWKDITKGYMTSSIVLRPWRKPVVNWPAAGEDMRREAARCERILERIANDLADDLPPLKGDSSVRPIRRVLRAISASGSLQGTSYFAYSFIEAKQWARERATICTVIEMLGRELADSLVDNFRFLIVIESTETKQGLLRRIREWIGLVRELGKKEGGPSPVDINGRPIWYRLPDLLPVKDTDLNVWAGLLAEAWDLNVEHAQLSLRERFTSKVTTFASASKELFENVLPELWLRSKARSRWDKG